MIITLRATTSRAINRTMVDLRKRGGTVALGRVLTLVIITTEHEEDAAPPDVPASSHHSDGVGAWRSTDSGGEPHSFTSPSVEEQIAAANTASFEHPCRVIVVVRRPGGDAAMDAQIRVGGDAGASEVIVLRLTGELAEHGAAVVVPLLLPDAPVVAWWPRDAPPVPADDPIGALANRRITDTAHTDDPASALRSRSAAYRPGDTDLAWTRITNWRGLLAAALDQPPYEEVTAARVAGAADSASTDLLAGWLALQLNRPVTRVVSGDPSSGLHRVELQRPSGPVVLSRPLDSTATLFAPGQPQRNVALPRRPLPDCIAEELRRLDADEVYADVLSGGLSRVTTEREELTSTPKGSQT